MSPVKSFALALALLPAFWNSASAAAPGVREILLPQGAEDVTYVRSRGDIRYKTAFDMKAMGDFYASQLGAKQWTKAKKDNLQKNFWVQSFAKAGLSLEVRVDARGEGCEVRLTPQGFAWDEDLAPRPQDLPIPTDAKDIKYDDFFERIEFQSATAPRQLAEFYATKLDAKTWSTSGTDTVAADDVKMERTNGKASVTVTIRKEGDGSQVSIKTRGMVWDEIKLANAAAKKAAEQVATTNSSEPKKMVELPKRVEKPLKGIAQLEKLPSRCVITVDGKPIELSHILAYETVSQGRWRTKIVATESAINERPLLERLKSTGSDEGWDLKSPYLKLELDEQDSPTMISLSAPKLAGGASRDELEGQALVEAGRVRGTVKQKPKSFFDTEYSAEITFDVPLLTRDSTPAKRLAEAPALANGGKLTIAGKTHALANVTVYETRQFDETVTAVLITERPINLAKLKASLAGPERNDSEFNEFQPQIKLTIDAREQVSGISVYCDGLSLSGSGWENLKTTVVIEEGRARGTAKTTESQEVFGKKVDFEVSFDTTVLPLPAAK